MLPPCLAVSPRASPAPSSSMNNTGHPNPSHQDHPCSLFLWKYARHCHPLSPKLMQTQSRCAQRLSCATVVAGPASQAMGWVLGRRKR